MGLLRYSFRSEALGYHVNVSIFYPSSAFTYMSDEEMGYNATFGEGKDFPGSPFDLYPAAKKHKEDGDELTNIVIACGSKEFIRERVEEDARILKELEYPVTYVLEEGYDHDYDMWDMELKRVCDEWLPLKDAIL